MVNGKNLRKLTLGEELWLDRRRHQETQREAAKRHEVSERKYNLAERDLWKPKAIAWNPPYHEPVYSIKMMEPSKGDRCALARRRDGRPLRKLAEKFGVSHVTFLKWERYGNKELIRAWRNLGYRF